MPVRRDALWYAATKRPDIAKQPLRAALLDDHSSMRETARQFLAAAAIEDARKFYVAAVEGENDKRRFAAICGLGETGNATDVSILQPFLSSPIAKMRRATVYAIGRLDVEGQLETLIRALSDAKPSVSREALKALQSKARHISISELENLFANGREFHVRRNALTLILHADKWKKLSLLLTACADEDARIAEHAAKALKAWSYNYNSSFAEPTREDFQRITSTLIRFEARLPHGVAMELRGCLKIYFK
jgi:HEAT repeat protein